MKTLNERAKAYADRNFAIQVGEIPSIIVDVSEHLKRAYIAGAKDALRSQWRSVDDELPDERDDDVLALHKTVGILEAEVAYFFNNKWHTTNGDHIYPTHWMSIPEFPKSK